MGQLSVVVERYMCLSFVGDTRFEASRRLRSPGGESLLGSTGATAA